MDRRMLGEGRDWQALRQGFRWRVPERFSIAEACCDSWARAEPERLALIELGEAGSVRRWSYGELKRASDRLANAFAARGLRRGERVAVLLPQGPAVLIAHFAAMKLGAVALPLFTLFGPDALQYRLADARARVVVTDRASLGRLDPIRAALPDLREVYCTEPSAERDFWAEIVAGSERLTPLLVA